MDPVEHRPDREALTTRGDRKALIEGHYLR
jgi:hypothetical protein